MTAQLWIEQPGALCSVQDGGRWGLRRLGVPRAGALAPHWLALARQLCGEAAEGPGLECFGGGLLLRAEGGPLHIGLGGPCAAQWLPAAEASAGGPERRAPRAVPAWSSLTLQPGEGLRLGEPRDGRVAYVAVAGLQIEPVLGSRSTYARAGFGGWQGRPLRAGDRLPVSARSGALPPASGAALHLRAPPTPHTGPVRVVPGPQDDFLDAEQWAVFLATDHEVTREADRMGIRLAGPVLRHRSDRGAEIVTDAVLPGAIQLPGHGQPIVLLADGHTAGGYPKIATVISADLPHLATRAVGSRVRFAAVSVAEAEEAARHAADAVAQAWASCQTLRTVGEPDEGALYGANLISGVLSGAECDA